MLIRYEELVFSFVGALLVLGGCGFTTRWPKAAEAELEFVSCAAQSESGGMRGGIWMPTPRCSLGSVSSPTSLISRADRWLLSVGISPAGSSWVRRQDGYENHAVVELVESHGGGGLSLLQKLWLFGGVGLAGFRGLDLEDRRQPGAVRIETQSRVHAGGAVPTAAAPPSRGWNFLMTSGPTRRRPFP